MAKTASKNNPLSRQGKRKIMYNDGNKEREALFTKIYDIRGKSFKTGCYDDGTLITKNGNPISWQLIVNNSN